MALSAFFEGRLLACVFRYDFFMTILAVLVVGVL